MHTVELKVEQDRIESLAKVRTPLDAVEELIWNGLDADAKRVNVDIILNKLSGLRKIKVRDDGKGIDPNICDHAFGTLGGSPKMRIATTPGGRIPHGKSGKGRFRAFGIGRAVTWLSRYKANGDIKEYTIKGLRSTLTQFKIADEQQSNAKQTGVEVTVDDIEQNFPSLAEATLFSSTYWRRWTTFRC
jgi:DNA topoisomerase VI subunit B